MWQMFQAAERAFRAAEPLVGCAAETLPDPSPAVRERMTPVATAACNTCARKQVQCQAAVCEPGQGPPWAPPQLDNSLQKSELR